jgi:hypothetical protein
MIIDVHPVTPAPIKALPCFCFFPPMAEKSKPPAMRVVGDSPAERIRSLKATLDSSFQKIRLNS